MPESEVALVTAGVEYDVLGFGFDEIPPEDREAVLAEKLPGLERQNFRAIIRGSEHST
jgi:hypothetical protein